MIVARYCNLAVYQDDLSRLSATHRTSGLSFSLVRESVAVWWRYETWAVSLGVAEWWTDTGARIEKWRLFGRGLVKSGWKRAWQEQSGLVVAEHT